MKKGFIVMDIPDNCDKCLQQVFIGKCHLNNERCNSYNSGGSEVTSEKPDWCPIKELPKNFITP